MKTVGIIIAILIGIVGLRLFGAGLRTLIMIFKLESVPFQTKERLFRDIFLGILLIILAIVIILP